MRKICMLEFFNIKREQEVGLLIESISQSASCGDVDLSEKSIALTTSVIFRIAFGKPSKGDGFHELISEVEALGSNGKL